MFDSKEIAQRALALAERKTALKRKRIKIAVSISSACAVFLFCLITVYTFNIFNIFQAEPDDFPDYEHVILEGDPIPLDGSFFPPDEAYTGAEPVFIVPDGELIFIAGNLEPELINPKENTCYLAFEIVLADTGETLYQSYLIAPGLRVQNIKLSRALEQGVYEAVLIIRAYDLSNINFIASEQADFILIVE